MVIWGFAENGVGMIVGNTATLRPLFKTLLEYKSSNHRSYRTDGFSGPHRSGDAFSRSYELEEGKNGTRTTTTAIGTQRKGSLSDAGSQEEILDNGRRPGQADIVISRHIAVEYEQGYRGR